jgi:hypothetical protein
LVLEVSNMRIGPSRRGSDVDMRAKDSRVNTGGPSSCVGESSRNWRSVRIRAGRGWKSERPIRAVKRVTIVERRGLGSRVRSEGARARAIGEKPSNLNEAFSRSRWREMPKRTRARPAGVLGGRKHQPPCPKAGCRESRMSGLMSGIWKRGLRATAPDLDSTIFYLSQCRKKGPFCALSRVFWLSRHASDTRKTPPPCRKWLMFSTLSVKKWPKSS